MHVEGEREGKGLLLAGGDGGVVSNGTQVAEYRLEGRGVGSKLLCGEELASHEGNLDRLRFMVGNLDNSLSGTAVDKLDTKDVSLGEGGDDISLQLNVGRAGSAILEGLENKQY